MSRTARLLQLMQLLRRQRYPVKGALLAQELGVSLRSLYRDIATLQQQGATIAGEAGLGFILKESDALPPLMFASTELDALALGAQWVASRADDELALAACDALAKITAVLPAAKRHELETSGLFALSFEVIKADDASLRTIRTALKTERKLSLSYCDEQGKTSERIIWPLALTFFERVQIVVAWCELRSDFRHFRCDRISDLHASAEQYPRRRQDLLKDWRCQIDITADRN